MHAYVRVGSCWFLWDSCFRAFFDIFRAVWFLWNACMPTHSEATEEEEPQEDEEVAETSPAPVKKDKRGSQKSQVLPGLRCCLISINQLKHVRKFCIILFCSILHVIHPLHVLHSTAMRCAIPFPWKAFAYILVKVSCFCLPEALSEKNCVAE